MPYYQCPACGLTSYSAAGHASASACPECSAALPDDAKRPQPLRAAGGMARALRARPEAAADARRAMAGLVLPQATRETLALLASELVTNCIRHAELRPGDPIDVITEDDAGRVRLSVHDGGPGFDPPTLREADPLAGGGRGLVIVAALSERWGVHRDEQGCTVWCEVVPQPPAAIEDEATADYVRELAVQMARSTAAMSA
jgi:anti-sigma regulatory factor (Ser/Thr protein kinase)